jgi:hypothetical protein
MTEKDLEDYIVKLLKEVEAIKVKLDQLFDKPSIFDRLEDFKVRLKILESQKSWVISFIAWITAIMIAVYTAFFK